MSRTLRSLVGALGCLLLVTIPTDVQAAVAHPPTARVAHPGPDGFSRAEARTVLHRATRLLRNGPSSTTAAPAAADLTMTLRDLHLARLSLTGADRRAANKLLSRATPAAKVQAASVAPTQLRCSTHFCLHFGSSTTSSWADTTLSTLEHVWTKEVPLMGREPLQDRDPDDTSTDPENPDERLDVFLGDLGADGYYGYCTTDDQSDSTKVAAYCALDNDFARRQFGAAPINSLRVTAAHEFYHAIQFAFDVSEDLWFMEGSAVWAEDVVYDSINDNYQYLPTSPIRYPRTSLDYSSGSFPYGSFIFFTYSAERRGTAIVRRYWEMAQGRRTSLQAIYAVVGHSSWASFLTMFGSWNTLPLHSYSERRGYPSPAWWQRRVLSARSPTTGVRSIKISHLGSAASLLAPDARLSPGKRLLVRIDGPNRASGTAALLQRRYRNGRVSHTMIKLAANGNGATLVRFNRKVLRSITVVVANTNRYGASRLFKVRASLR